MEKGAGGGDDPAMRAAGGMCDRFLTFVANNLSMSRQKNINEGPRNGGGGGDLTQAEEEDEFSIQIERTEFDLEPSGHGDDGYSGVTTILEESAAARDDVHEQHKGASAAADGPVAAGAGAAPAVAVEETKVRKAVTIREEDGGGAPVVERKRSLFWKRQASSAGAAEEQGGRAAAPRRSGLRPRMPTVLRVPTNINERSSAFIAERRKGFGGGKGKPAPATDK